METETSQKTDYRTAIEHLADDVRDYVQTSTELYKMQATAKGAEMGAGLIIGVIVGVCISMTFLFLSLAGAFLINEAYGNSYIGFVLVGAIYALLALIIFIWKGKGLKENLADRIVKQVYGKED